MLYFQLDHGKSNLSLKPAAANKGVVVAANPSVLELSRQTSSMLEVRGAGLHKKETQSDQK